MAGAPPTREAPSPAVIHEFPPSARIVTARAVVQQMPGDACLTAAQEMRAASWMPMVTDGEPTKLLVTAWLAHEGRNNNGQEFRAEDLAAAAAKITSPNLLPMDWNHGAVLPWSDDPKAIGAWYAAEAKHDPEAKDGAGALGIEAKGVVWAWAFQEQAIEMLALQAAHGFVEFSMAAIPKTVELRINDTGFTEVLVEPVFFTLSALNVPPADPDAKGLVDLSGRHEDEDEDKSGESAAAYDLATALVTAQQAQQTKEAGVDSAEAAALVAANESLVIRAEAAEQALAAHAATADELTAATARADEASLRGDALQAELAIATEQLAALTTQLEAATAQLADIAAARETEERATRWAARFAALPETYRAAFARRAAEEQERFTSRWSAASDEDWVEFTGDLLVGFTEVKLSYLQLTQDEGKLPVGADGAVDLGARVAALRSS